VQIGESAKDALHNLVMRYTQKSTAYNYPLDELNGHVSELLEILLSDSDEKTMMARIRSACERKELPKLGKRRLGEDSVDRSTPAAMTKPLKRHKTKE
jgi:hypothetical protein